MQQDHSDTTWRDFLREYIADSTRRQELAQAACLNPVTLARWCQAEGPKPHKSLLEGVAKVLPEEERRYFVFLVQQEFPDFAPLFEEKQKHVTPIEEVPDEIPDEFIYRVLRAWSYTHRTHAFSTILQLVIPQMTLHCFQGTAPGMSLLLLTPPRGDAKVRSLYTPLQPLGVWPASLVHFPVFLGVETVLSIALIRHEACVFSQTLFPDEPTVKDIKSTLAIALRKSGCVGGCFIMLSPEAGYFQHPKRQKLIEKYSYLLSLALEEFYDPGQIQLQVMPSFSSQLAQERRFPFARRLEQLQIERTTASLEKQERPPSLTDLEREAIQELESDMLRIVERLGA
jgi:hypothetical protein